MWTATSVIYTLSILRLILNVCDLWTLVFIKSTLIFSDEPLQVLNYLALCFV